MNQELIEMARQAHQKLVSEVYVGHTGQLDPWTMELLKIFASLVAAAEREACERKTEEFAQKWWKIHCDSNIHYSTTLEAHDDFCELKAAIRATGETK